MSAVFDHFVYFRIILRIILPNTKKYNYFNTPTYKNYSFFNIFTKTSYIFRFLHFRKLGKNLGKIKPMHQPPGKHMGL